MLFKPSGTTKDSSTPLHSAQNDTTASNNLSYLSLTMVSCSVIIPTLREAATIGQLITALKAQDHAGPLEVIVVDGGSGDGPKKLCASLPMCNS